MGGRMRNGKWAIRACCMTENKGLMEYAAIENNNGGKTAREMDRFKYSWSWGCGEAANKNFTACDQAKPHQAGHVSFARSAAHNCF